MLNLVNLISTLMITTGVATATPVCNSHKEPRINKPLQENSSSNNSSSNPNVNNYSLTLDMNRQEEQAFAPETINNYTGNLETLNIGYDVEQRTLLQKASAYINVIGNIYESRAKNYTNMNQGNEYYTNFQNYYNIENDINNYYSNTTRSLYVLKITPYNYNINNEILINLTFNIVNPLINWVEEYSYTATDLYFRLGIYQTNQSNWNNLLQRQNVKWTAQQIVNDIEDVNNGYYYTKQTQLNLMWSDEEGQLNDTYTVQQQFSISPQRDNYIVLDVMPCLKAYYPSNNQNVNEKNIPFKTNDLDGIAFRTENITITGTNVVPSGTYEVLDLPGLMWEILTMPFAFVSQAFNLTLFPGTPYQLNIANLFLTIIAIFVFIWLLSMIIKGRTGG